MAVNYRVLKLVCECGKVPKCLADVGLTEDGQLVVHWRCRRCSTQVYLVKPITDGWSEGLLDRDRPREHDWDEKIYDRRFLRTFKIKYPDE